MVSRRYVYAFELAYVFLSSFNCMVAQPDFNALSMHHARNEVGFLTHSYSVVLLLKFLTMTAAKYYNEQSIFFRWNRQQQYVTRQTRVLSIT